MNRVDGELVLKKMEKDEKKLERTKRKLAKEIAKVRDSQPAISKKKIYIKNQKKRVAIKKEISERIEIQERENEIEQERRNDMIRQIRAVERVPKLKATVRWVLRFFLIWSFEYMFSVNLKFFNFNYINLI